MDRQATLTRILDELSSHSPTQAMRNMRHWPGGRLSLVHLNVLFILEADGPLPMRGLAEAMDVSQASATGIVDRMEQRGLVERQRDDEDRRVVRVAITDEGLRLVAGMANERREHLVQMLGEFTDDELAAFLTGALAMRRVRERLHAAHAAAHEPAADAGRPSGRDTGRASGRDAGRAADHPDTPSDNHGPDPQETSR
jgi:DNA-binding MarR family transcriptional regulator